MAGKIEIRKRGEKFRLVVLNSRGDMLLQGSGQDDKAAVKRQAASLVKAVTGAEVIDATKPAAAATGNGRSRVAAGRKPATRRKTTAARRKS